jgi:TonB family protein
LNLNSPQQSSLAGSGDLDETTAMASLKELIAAGDHRLDPMLAAIADAARQLTGASGAAIAMWKEGVMVCRARSGDTAPPLGARLSADTGISGECLRTGKVHHCQDTENDPLVDVEVCRALGLRSMAVLPIQGWRGINGILEVFSTKPKAFSEQHIAFLEQLASLAERARATQPHGASSTAPKKPVENAQPSGLLPASDRVGDVALALVKPRSRPFVLGAAGLCALALLAAVAWLGWRGASDADARAQAAAPSSVNLNPMAAHPPDNDPVWKAHPGGQALMPSGSPASGTSVQLAAKLDAIPDAKPSPNRKSSSLLADLAEKVAVPHGGSASSAASLARPVRDRQDFASALDAPVIPDTTNASELNAVLSPNGSLPKLTAPVSQGVSGGQLVRRVSPVYPAQARLLRLEGTVVLDATVMEDGTVGDIKVVEGDPELAPAAVEAVKRWRYKPFNLDGKPVKNKIDITLEFKLPSESASR